MEYKLCNRLGIEGGNYLCERFIVLFNYTQGAQTICSIRNLKDLYGNITKFVFLRITLTFFFKINFPQLLHFVVLAAVNTEYWRF